MKCVREAIRTENIAEDCPNWKLDPMLTVKIMLDWGFLDGDCFVCMYYDPISGTCCKEGGDNRHDAMS